MQIVQEKIEQEKYFKGAGLFLKFDRLWLQNIKCPVWPSQSSKRVVKPSLVTEQTSN